LKKCSGIRGPSRISTSSDKSYWGLLETLLPANLTSSCLLGPEKTIEMLIRLRGVRVVPWGADEHRWRPTHRLSAVLADARRIAAPSP
jgi:hypothetical protein